MIHLTLFDIDGTLLRSKGAGRRAMRRALEAVFGTAGDIDTYPMAGKTDQVIIRDVLQAARIPLPQIVSHMSEYRRVYARVLVEELTHTQPEPLPGALDLVKRLHARPDVILGLLTGNLEEGARLKLRAAGFDPALFVVTAFGSDAVTRDQLPQVALERARALTGHMFWGKQVVIVGDTPNDIRCGRPVGAKSVAVATGPFSLSELAAHGPDILLPDLQDVDRAERAILDGSLHVRR